MGKQGRVPAQIRTGKRSSLWLALAIALGLHLLVLLLPLAQQIKSSDKSGAEIEVQLVTVTPPAPEPVLAEKKTEITPPETEPESTQEPVPEATEAVVETTPVETPVEPEPHLLDTAPQTPELQRTLENMTELEQRQLTNTILTRQFISEESVVDQLFGKRLEPDSSEPQKEFHYPMRPDMLAMLDQPMPELPFAYEQGLVRFAYDPGVKGDLQRFWDVITPEFGWRTKYGTEVKCIYVLVIVACGWK